METEDRRRNIEKLTRRKKEDGKMEERRQKKEHR